MNPGKSIEDLLIDSEMSLLQPSVRKLDMTSQLLAEDLLAFCGSRNVFTKSEVMRALQVASTVKFDASQFHARFLAPNMASLTCSALRHSEPPLRSSRCSMWEQKKGHWQMVFHQGTLGGQLS
ncbi:MAG: DUF4440 domain-containing protein [Acidiferrobacterales bacterium]